MEVMVQYLQLPAAFLMLCFSLIQCSKDFKSSPDGQGEISPQDVKFHSVDYRNVLHWKPNALFSSEQKYFVQYKIYGDKHWINVTHCQGIRQYLCDLSEETADAREYYYARVQAALPGVRSSWVLSSRFNPHWQTSLSLPKLKLEATEQGIVVQLRAPSSPNMRKKDSCVSIRKWQRLIYRIYVTCDDIVQEEHSMEGCVTELLIADLRPRTPCCFQAEVQTQRLGRTSAKGKKSCITTV
ncbi:interleukin-22 receptor subunit alpha-2 [Conger conger]|uniref:interleukin-22 receptor subunit alpha-2 n=1 Tax=Conger conger TaxID=82655 RepID=UPI002A599CFA|nr:interleukin-22 receptor subunit alpha-2 [Conger conger]